MRMFFFYLGVVASAARAGDELSFAAPFDAVAALVVSFRSQGVPYEVRLALPCVFTKFLEPVQLSPNVFVQRWATLGATLLTPRWPQPTAQALAGRAPRWPAFRGT